MDESKKDITFSNRENNDEREVSENAPAVRKPSFMLDTSFMPLTITEDYSEYVDPKVVSKKFYNNFNFSKLLTDRERLSLGVTSANPQEGKTLVACNMAVSLTRAYRQRTVLVDLNFRNPQLHNVFRASAESGLAEALQKEILRVTPTGVDNLFVLPAGDVSRYSPGIKDTITLREVLFTLKNAFDFVIVDMNSVFPIEEFPVHFINEVDGLLTVVDTKQTKKELLNKIFNHIDERRFMGYIFNRYEGS